MPTQKSILIISNKKDIHVDRVAHLLIEAGVTFFRFNTEEFPLNSSFTVEYSDLPPNVRIQTPRFTLLGERVSAVWYRRPEPPEFEGSHLDPSFREYADTQCRISLRSLWDIIPAFWISPPHNIIKAERKIGQLQTAISIGLSIPKTIITNKHQHIQAFLRDNKERGCIAKVLVSDPVFPITTQLIDQNLIHKIENIKYAPCIIQELIKKSLDLRITVVGKKVFATEIHSQSIAETQIDWRHPLILEGQTHHPHKLPLEVERACLKLVEAFGLQFGAIDMVLNKEGEYIFLELNPNGAWLWIERLTKAPIAESIAELLISKI